jgi:hypothetical protein
MGVYVEIHSIPPLGMPASFSVAVLIIKSSRAPEPEAGRGS